jgi:hypothetical protein
LFGGNIYPTMSRRAGGQRLLTAQICAPDRLPMPIRRFAPSTLKGPALLVASPGLVVTSIGAGINAAVVLRYKATVQQSRGSLIGQ